MSTPRPGWRSRAAMAARTPSSANIGGSRTSTMASPGDGRPACAPGRGHPRPGRRRRSRARAAARRRLRAAARCPPRSPRARRGARAHEDVLERRVLQAGGLELAVGALRFADSGRRAVRLFVPVTAPIAVQPTTSTSHSTIIVRGRRAAPRAAPRTRRARAPSAAPREGAVGVASGMAARSHRGGAGPLGCGGVSPSVRPRRPGGAIHPGRLTQGASRAARPGRWGRSCGPSATRAT
jgi:hypothetical protein